MGFILDVKLYCCSWAGCIFWRIDSAPRYCAFRSGRFGIGGDDPRFFYSRVYGLWVAGNYLLLRLACLFRFSEFDFRMLYGSFCIQCSFKTIGGGGVS